MALALKPQEAQPSFPVGRTSTVDSVVILHSALKANVLWHGYFSLLLGSLHGYSVSRRGLVIITPARFPNTSLISCLTPFFVVKKQRQPQATLRQWMTQVKKKEKSLAPSDPFSRFKSDRHFLGTD